MSEPRQIRRVSRFAVAVADLQFRRVPGQHVTVVVFAYAT
jgi:hypothetical protein